METGIHIGNNNGKPMFENLVIVCPTFNYTQSNMTAKSKFQTVCLTGIVLNYSINIIVFQSLNNYVE